MSSLVWFRDDLRTVDHPALYAASLQGIPVKAIYFVTPDQWARQDLAPIRADLLERHLNSVGKTLAELGIPLHVMTVADYAAIPSVMGEFCSQHDISNLYINRDIGIYELKRDAAVQAECELRNIHCHWFDARCLFAPGTVLTGSGEMFKVYTPFSRAWLKKLMSEGYQVWSQPRAQEPVSDWQPVSIAYPKISSQSWLGNEHEVLHQLRQFAYDKLIDYTTQRDFPAIDGTSQLSPYLALGVITIRQCLAVMQEVLESLPFDKSEPGFTWLNELIWREFYQHLLVAYPHVCMNKGFKPETDLIRWPNDKALFTAWSEGNTGYPIVDAAMRCLNQTGWMHNRLRMIVASFLVKDLHIDWRWGERYFMQHLIDGELAANNGGWQWAASTGADAAPYFRIFNPTTQGQKFDEQGIFIKRWLPELSQVPEKYIHTPHDWLKIFDPSTSYPKPIVEHAQAREITLGLFKQ